jgi:hypothetical protein
MKRKIPPRLGTLREGERFPTDEEFPQCVEVECPTCHSRGYALPGMETRCPTCGTTITVRGIRVLS